MNNEIEIVFYCYNCGFAVETSAVSTYCTDPAPLPNQIVCDESEIDYEHEEYSLRKCPKCESPFLHKYTYLDHHEAGTFRQDIEQLFPTQSEQLLSIGPTPTKVSKPYQKAKECFDKNLFEPSIIMCRKSLEAICLDLGAKGKSLSHKIESLHNAKKIDEKLYNWASELRLIGNDAAHEFNVTIRRNDARDAIIFLNALLLYIYTLDKKFETFKKRRRAP